MLDASKKLRITLESHGEKYVFESWSDDYNAGELLDIFKRMMVAATYSPSILSAEDGRWEWISRGSSEVKADEG